MLDELKQDVGKIRMAKLRCGTNFEKFLFMRSILFFIAIFAFGLTQAQDANKKDGVKKIRHEALTFQGELAFFQGKPFTGMSFTFWDNKRINEQFSWYEGQQDGVYKQSMDNGTLVTLITYAMGVKEGPYEYYYDNGALQSKGNFKRGELDGLVQGFYSTGIHKYEVMYSLGIRHGVSKSWFKNGAPEQVANYVNNLPHGEVTEFYSDSVVWSESEYNMGVRHGKYYQFHKKSGCAAIESYYKKGKLDSIRRIWNEVNCQLIEEEHYLNGEKHGEFILYDFTGDTLTVNNYQYGILNGEFKQYYNKTKPEMDPTTGTVARYDTKHGVEVLGNYADGKADGFWQYGLVSNYQHREGNYESGTMVGHWIFYDTQGRILMEQDYDEDGNIVKERLYKRPRKKSKK